MKMDGSSKIDDIFQEIRNWETDPINELLGGIPRTRNQSINRIIVYGPTQVGKTTLIMDLIGIKPERQKELERILRGNTPKGTSSTSSAIVYERCTGNKFGLLQGDINGVSDSEPVWYDAEKFCGRIGEINAENRDTATAKSGIPGRDILYYFIPDTFFADDAPNELLQIVDLPGFAERNEKMKKRADEIIEYLSEIVAGAIVVVKSENIQKLESDYKSFIERHHQNHLAIVVTYALKTSKELKLMREDSALIDGCENDRMLAIKLSEHYRQRIKDEKYMRFDENVQEQIIFPVEHSGFLAEHYPDLCGAFAESRKLLRERVGRMKNRTSIAACMEELKQHSTRMEKALQEEKARKQTEEDQLKQIQNQCVEIDETLQSRKLLADSAAKNLEGWCDALKIIKDAVGKFTTSKLMTENQASDFWDDHCEQSQEKRQGALYEWLRGKMASWLAPQEPVHKDLYPKLMACIDNELGCVDYEDMLKKRDHCGFLGLGRAFGYDSCDYASRRAITIAKNVQGTMYETISRYEQKTGGELRTQAREAELRWHRAKEEKRKYDDRREQAAKDVEDSVQRLRYYDEQIKRNSLMQKNVKKVFVKHYYQKEAELYKRIEQEEEPETKAALLIVLGAINMTMKPYLEEINHA